MNRIRKQLEAVAGKFALVVAGPRKPLRVEVGDPGECIYFLVSERPVKFSREIAPEVIADYDADGALVGFEVIGALRKRAVVIPGTARRRADRRTPADVQPKTAWRVGELTGA